MEERKRPARKRAFCDVEIQRFIGGAKRDRTADLNTASVALSQLSYSPVKEGAILGTAPWSVKPVLQDVQYGLQREGGNLFPRPLAAF